MSIITTWNDFAGASGVAPGDDPSRILLLFADEIEDRCDLVLGQGGSPLGLMIKSGGASFESRVVETMKSWGHKNTDLSILRAFSKRFCNRGFITKFEWFTSSSVFPSRRITFHFPCASSLDKILKFFSSRGIDSSVLDALECAPLFLQKKDIRFVSCGFQLSHPPVFKLYFQHRLLNEDYESLVGLIGDLFNFFEFHSDVSKEYVSIHRSLFSASSEQPFFSSLNFTSNHILDTFKLDYCSISPAACKPLFSSDYGDTELARIRHLCAATRSDRLSYLAVRVGNDASMTPKYYVKARSFY